MLFRSADLGRHEDAGSLAANFRELPAAIAQVAGFEAFMASYRERVKSDSLSAIN